MVPPTLHPGQSKLFLIKLIDSRSGVYAIVADDEVDADDDYDKSVKYKQSDSSTGGGQRSFSAENSSGGIFFLQ